MRQLMRMGLVVLLLVGILSILQSAFAQEVTAGITGTVTDPSGAAVKGANITATDTDRGTIFTAQTDASGIFTITRLPIGTYSVRAAAQGFDTAVYPSFTLVLNQTAKITFQMKMGQVSQTVDVLAEAPLLQSQSTEVSTLIDANTNVSLPLASRNYLQ